jgi:hypothetical protein
MPMAHDDNAAIKTIKSVTQQTEEKFDTMGRLVISRADCCAMSARRRTTAHITIVSTVLCTGYVVNKTVSCVLMNVILVTMI